MLIRAKRIVTNSNNTIVKSDFKLYGIALFADLRTVANACQYLYHVNSPVPNCNITLLSKNTKSMQTRASKCNKAFLLKSKKSCDNCFCFNAPKVWNCLPNKITCLNNFNSFYFQLCKHVFNK